MKQLGLFLKTTTVGGLFVLLPVLLMYLLLAELMDVAIAVATPIADLLFSEAFRQTQLPGLMAIMLIVVVSFVCGLLMRLAWSRAGGRWIERNVLLPVPGYRALKGIIQSFGGADEAKSFRPMLLLSENGQREIAYLVEEHDDGQATVLLPWSPTPMAGSVKIVPRSQLQELNLSLAEVTGVLSHWGMGIRDLIRKAKETGCTSGIEKSQS